MTDSSYILRIFNSLAGEWSIERTYDGEGVVSGHAEFKGTASLKKIDGVTILYSEAGELRADDGSVNDVSKRYYYSYDEEKDQITKWFYEGEGNKSIFYSLNFSDDFTRAYGEHLCGKDSYCAEYEFENHVLQSMEYKVTSSYDQEKSRRKSYIINTQLHRV